MFDESQAIEYIRTQLSPEVAKLYQDDDELLNVIDMIWDYYELNGLLDIDADDEEEDTDQLFDELVEYVRKTLKQDKEAHVREEDIPLIVKAEMEYEKTLEDEF